MKSGLTAALMMGLLFPCAPAMADAPAQMVANVEADKIVAAFFEQVKAGQVTPAVDALFSASPLMSGRIAEKQQLAAQTETAVRIYGRITAVELVESKALGSMLVRRYYIVQHANMLTRWEFDLARLPGGGWTMIFFGFNDQAQSWF